MSTADILAVVQERQTHGNAIELADAVRVVLDLHQEDGQTCAYHRHCRHCGSVWPCVTVRAVAAELGVEL